MIPLPPSTRIFLACGATDMRKGFDGLAVMVQQVLTLSPHSGALFAFGASAAISSSCSGMMVRNCACFPKGWIAAGLSGHRPRPARWQYGLASI
jgi:transposase